MELERKTTQSLVKRKHIKIKTILYLYGLLAILGLVVSIFSTSLTMNKGLQLGFNEELMLKPKKVKELIVFIVIAACVYFPAVHLYFKKKG